MRLVESVLSFGLEKLVWPWQFIPILLGLGVRDSRPSNNFFPFPIYDLLTILHISLQCFKSAKHESLKPGRNGR